MQGWDPSLCEDSVDGFAALTALKMPKSRGFRVWGLGDKRLLASCIGLFGALG